MAVWQNPLYLSILIADISCLVICFMGFIIFSIGYRLMKRMGIYFLLMFLINILLLVNDMADIFLYGKVGRTYDLLRTAMYFWAYLGRYLINYIFTRLVFLRIRMKGGEVSQAVRYAIFAYYVVAVTLLMISQVNHMYYDIDGNGKLIAGPANVQAQIIGIMMNVIIIGTTVFYRRVYSRKEIISTFVYFSVPIMVRIWQLEYPNTYLVQYATTFCLFLTMITVLLSQSRQHYEIEKQRNEIQVNLMLSQIQPHFIYNTLGSIQYLYAVRPAEGEQMLESFSHYLRGNMESLTRTEPIPFEKDLKHLEYYLDIEKKRFKKITVEYHLQTMDFEVPALTLQPLVENAIVHGLTRQKEGGTVTISTIKEESGIRLLIEDDGVGFDPAAVEKDGKRHIGLENTANRIQQMCGGNLSVKSACGAGTLVTITIPTPPPKIEGKESTEDKKDEGSLYR